jgi:hypothetical protein
MFIGGCPSRKEHTMMQSCIKVVGKESGCNLLDPMQWVDIHSIAFSYPTRKNITMNNIITISDGHVSRVRTNTDVVNEVIICNQMKCNNFYHHDD